MEQRNKTGNRIELRSEKVRKITGSIPSALVRWGFAVIILILAILVAVIIWFPYPYGEGETIIQHILKTV